MPASSRADHASPTAGCDAILDGGAPAGPVRPAGCASSSGFAVGAAIHHPSRESATVLPRAARRRTIQCLAIVAPADSSAPARRRSPSRSIRTAALLAVPIALVILAIAAIREGRAPIRPLPGASASVPAVVADRGYLVTLPELKARVAAAGNGQQPDQAALADLVAWAQTAVHRSPDPSEPLRIDGTTGPFVDDSATAYGLALAWGATGDLQYATAAHDFVMAWAQRTRTLLGACPADGDCQTSLIVSRTAPGFVFATDLLATSGVFTTADMTAFDDWLRTVILPAASERTNNWGDAGTFLRVVATDHLGDAAGFGAAIDAWRTQLDLVAADGHIPEEVRRGSSGLSYTQEALLYKLAVARIAERRGIDLWSYRGIGGATLHDAVDLAARYQLDSSGWPWASHVEVPTAGPGWELAYAHWRDPAVATILAPVRPLGWLGHSAVRWTTLTNGIPLGD